MSKRVRVLLVVLPSTFPAGHQVELLSGVLGDVVSLDGGGKRSRSVTGGYLDSQSHPAVVATLLEVIARERNLALHLVGDSLRSSSVQ